MPEFTRKDFPQGMTIEELRGLIAEWPTLNPETGELYEVWIMTGENLSGPVLSASRLNRNDIVLGCETWPA